MSDSESFDPQAAAKHLLGLSGLEALRLMMEIQAPPLVLDALVGLAVLLQAEQPALSEWLLQLAARHPASGRETQQRALQQLEMMQTAVAPGELEKLDEIVAGVLRALRIKKVSVQFSV